MNRKPTPEKEHLYEHLDRIRMTTTAWSAGLLLPATLALKACVNRGGCAGAGERGRQDP